MLAMRFIMERDALDEAIDIILAAADGDVRRALRAVLRESVVVAMERHQSNSESAQGKQDKKSSLH